MDDIQKILKNQERAMRKVLGDGGSSNKKKNERDSRRSFSSTQKKEILYQQNNKCGRCHKSLDPREIEFDHIRPWADKGRTMVINGRVLCGSCHKIVTHETKLKKVDKKRSNSSKNKNSDYFGLLKKQKNGLGWDLP
jgi:nitrate/TMAO reductase-like tetraheme cytochrome c subunit